MYILYSMTTKSIYFKRRALLTNTYTRTLFVIASGKEANRSHSVKYRFKPCANFSYLCGLHLSESLLLIIGKKTYLFSETPSDQIWGEHTEISNQDKYLLEGITIEPLSRLETLIKDSLGRFDRIAMTFGLDKDIENRIFAMVSYDRNFKKLLHNPITVCDSRLLIGQLRLKKDENEIEQLKEACARTSKVHRELMRIPLIGKTERQVSNWIEAHFLMEDMQWASYETIVGVGSRSTILHARASDLIIKNADSVLVDAGGEWKGYCADVTRVVPAGSGFSENQKSIYNIVLSAQKLVLRAIRPGTSLKDLHSIATESLIEGLVKKCHYKEALVRDNIKKLMPHSTSHWIGMDVHDPAPYIDDAGNEIRLSSGMTFTVEPGLYFRDSKEFAKYAGIGVRIEDNVVVTENGNEVLTDVPREVDEIEQLRVICENQN